MLENTRFFVIFQGGGVRTPCLLFGSAHGLQRKPSKFIKQMLRGIALCFRHGWLRTIGKFLWFKFLIYCDFMYCLGVVTKWLSNCRYLIWQLSTKNVDICSLDQGQRVCVLFYTEMASLHNLSPRTPPPPRPHTHTAPKCTYSKGEVRQELITQSSIILLFLKEYFVYAFIQTASRDENQTYYWNLIT